MRGSYLHLKLHSIYSRLSYPRTHIESVITTYSLRDTSGPSTNVAERDVTAQSELVFFQRSSFGNTVRRYLHDLSYKISPTVQPLFVSQKLEQAFWSKEVKPSDVNQQCIVYHFSCDLCDADYFGYTTRHLSYVGTFVSIGKHLQVVHNLRNKVSVINLYDNPQEMPSEAGLFNL